MEKPIRQSDLSVDEILSLYEAGGSGYPKCFLINELCAIDASDENPKIREKLADILKSDTEAKEKYPAFCYLMSINKPDPELALCLASFLADEKNDDIIKRAKENGHVEMR